MQTDSKYLKETSHVANPGASGCLRSSQYDRINLVTISKNLYGTVHVVVKKGIHQLLQTIKILLVVLWTLHLLWLSNNLLYAIFCMPRCSCHTLLYKRPVNNIIVINFFLLSVQIQIKTHLINVHGFIETCKACCCCCFSQSTSRATY